MDTSIVVDKSRGQALTVWLNVTFPRIPCYRAFSQDPERQLN
jgi:endoplasmic reticulum-Golgi intermediate compartment protein 3